MQSTHAQLAARRIEYVLSWDIGTFEKNTWLPDVCQVLHESWQSHLTPPRCGFFKGSMSNEHKITEFDRWNHYLYIPGRFDRRTKVGFVDMFRYNSVRRIWGEFSLDGLRTKRLSGDFSGKEGKHEWPFVAPDAAPCSEFITEKEREARARRPFCISQELPRYFANPGQWPFSSLLHRILQESSQVQWYE